MSPVPERSPAQLTKAFAVHVLTASGVALGLMALLAAHDRAFTAMFVWLAAALAVDGIDGPLARKLKVAELLPHWSGETLDLVVDYVTYVLVPAYALILSGIVPAPWSYVAACAICITSALYFADGRMKTPDAYFRGFPAAWNVVVFYLFVTKPSALFACLLVAVLCVLTFLPVRFVHPFRVRELRYLTLGLLFAWAALATTALAYDLSPPAAVVTALVVLALYFLGAGFFRTRTP